jgi:PAS domain S-box-containing protein
MQGGGSPMSSPQWSESLSRTGEVVAGDASPSLHSTREVLGFANRAARMGQWTLHLTEDRVRCSPELEDVFGLPRGSGPTTRDGYFALVSPLDLARLRKVIEDSLVSREEFSVSFRFRHHGGEWRWIECRGLPNFDAMGKPLRIDGVCMDVTDRVMAENARFLLAAIVANSDDAIISKTLDGVVTSWNAGATRLFGYTAEEMIGSPIFKLIPPDLLMEEEEILSKLRRGERIDHYETRRRTRDGTLVDVSLTVSPVLDVTGSIVGASKIARDISALRRAQADRDQLLMAERRARAEAERLGHMKDEFLATLSHELRTPLTTIIGWTNLLRRRATVSQEEMKAAVETIYRNARAQAQIIDDLLDMSRIISGKIRLQSESVDLRDLVNAALDSIQPSAASKQIEVIPLLDPATGVIAGDPARLQQVLWNLLTNAIKFTPTGGRIHVRLRWLEDGAEISVTDTGIGIAPEFLPHVFERFRQADGSTTREHGGLGLGLSIVRNLVELHGGSVAVSSPGTNRGSTFTVRLPVLGTRAAEVPAGTRAAIPEPSPEQFLPNLGGHTVLVIDDEPDGRALLARLLREAGAEVIAAEGAEQALQLLAQRPVDAILSDIGMPGMDGYAFMRRLRAMDDSRLRGIPAIAVTAYARADDRERSLAAGFQQHMAKPYSFTDLTLSISALLPHLTVR